MGRKGGLASVAAQKERLGETGYLEKMQEFQNFSPDRSKFFEQLERDLARAAERVERHAQAKKGAPRQVA